MRILGIDPGSQVTGYGVIDSDGRRSQHVASGNIRLGSGPLPPRLGRLYTEIEAVVKAHAPDVLAVEQVFVGKSISSALILGHARGAAITACVQAGLNVFEYAPRAVKQAVVGSGAADKAQVQHMIRVLLGLAKAPPADASDALAVALCHAHTYMTNATLKRLAR